MPARPPLVARHLGCDGEGVCGSAARRPEHAACPELRRARGPGALGSAEPQSVGCAALWTCEVPHCACAHISRTNGRTCSVVEVARARGSYVCVLKCFISVRKCISIYSSPASYTLRSDSTTGLHDAAATKMREMRITSTRPPLRRPTRCDSFESCPRLLGSAAASQGAYGRSQRQRNGATVEHVGPMARHPKGRKREPRSGKSKGSRSSVSGYGYG